MGGESGDAGVVVGGWVLDGAGGNEGGTDVLAVGRGNSGLTSDAGTGEVVVDGCAPEELGLG